MSEKSEETSKDVLIAVRAARARELHAELKKKLKVLLEDPATPQAFKKVFKEK